MPVDRKWTLTIGFMLAVTVGLCVGVVRLIDWFTLPDIRRPSVRQTLVPLSLDDARLSCPIPLPPGASNIQYAVWSMGSVTQSWIRFEAPNDVCLNHAADMLESYGARDGWGLDARPIANDTGVVCVLDPTEVDLSWFEPAGLTGTVLRVTGGRAPVIWVDTNANAFYCEIKNDLQSLSPK